MNNTKKIAISGLVIALYVVIMYFTQSFSFGQYQVRIATGLYALGYEFPFLIVALGIANLISNSLMGGLGPLDMIGGCIVGMVTTLSIVGLKKINTPKFIAVLPIALIPSLGVPLWLSPIIHVPYLVLVGSLLVGQTISAYTLGIFLINLNIFKKNKRL